MKIKCPACGAENYFTGIEDEDTKFCSNCNAPLNKPTGANKKLSNANRYNQRPDCNTYDEAEETANKDRQTEEQIKKYERSFLWKYGGGIVYIVFLVGFFLNGGIATFYFLNKQWLLGIWAIFSIFLLPKSILGFILRLSYLILRNPLVFLNMPQIMWKIFPGTMQNYRRDTFNSSGNPMLKEFIKETILIVISLIPFIIFIIQNSDISI